MSCRTGRTEDELVRLLVNGRFNIDVHLFVSCFVEQKEGGATSIWVLVGISFIFRYNLPSRPTSSRILSFPSALLHTAFVRFHFAQCTDRKARSSVNAKKWGVSSGPAYLMQIRERKTSKSHHSTHGDSGETRLHIRSSLSSSWLLLRPIRITNCLGIRGSAQHFDFDHGFPIRHSISSAT